MPQQLASVFYGRISGLADLNADLAEQEFNELLNEFFRRTESAIRMYNGIILEFSGETFTAIFQEEQSQLNSIEAGKECQESVNSILKEKSIKPSIAFKAGIAHARVVKYKSPSLDKQKNENAPNKVMGEAVDLAERLFTFAESGQILVNHAVYEKTKTHWKYNELESLHIPDRKGLIEVYELKDKKRKKIITEISDSRQISSEMVGRENEMKIIQEKINELLDGKGCILNIVGKAGIGKSRLMAEIKVQPYIEKVQLLEGRAFSTGQNLSFHPIANLIKSWAEISGDDIPSVSSEKLRQGIKIIAPQQSDEIYAFLATMMGLPLKGKYKDRVKGIEGEALEKLILKNLRDLVIAATRDKPRIYLIEDLHWSDSSSITLFESLYKLSRNYPVMFINVMRPGYEETGDYILKHLEDHFPAVNTTIHINPLEEEESLRLIINLLRKTQLPEEIRSIIIRKTEGNPFFIEEIIRSFIDEGIVDAKDGHFVVTNKIKDVNIPETINDAILSRVDKLDEKTRELLNTASVMGRNFYYKVLEEATDTIEELDDRLSYLTEVQLISESKKKEEIQYLFKHALAQQLTYDAMMQQSRKETHLKIARSIEKVFAETINEFYGTLVYHYELAEDKEKAIYYMLLAGDEAIRSGASHEALNFYEKAHKMILRDESQNLSKEQMLDLEMRIADLYRACGKNLEAAKRFRKLIVTYTKYRFLKNEKQSRLRAVYSLLLTYIMVHNHRFFFKKKMNQEMETLMQLTYGFGTCLISMNPKQFAIDTLPILKKLCRYNFTNSVPSLRVFCTGSSNFGMTGLSLNTSQKMIDISEKSGIEKDVFGKIGFRMNNKMQNYYSGRWYNQEDEQSVITQGLRAGSFWDTQIYMTYCGFNHIETGEYEKTIEMQNLLHEQAENYNSGFAVSMAYRLQAYGFYKFRKFDEFLRIADEGAKYIGSTENSAFILVFFSMQTLVHLKFGNTAKAEEALIKANEIQEQVSNIPVYHTPYLLAKVHFGLEKLQKQNKNSKEYKALLNEIKQNSKTLIAKSIKMIANLPEAYLLRARLYFVQNKHSSAFKSIQMAIITCEKHKSRLELSRAYFEAGKFLSNPKVKYNELNGKDSKYYLQKAKTMFEEMDLEWDLNEFEAYKSKVM